MTTIKWPQVYAELARALFQLTQENPNRPGEPLFRLLAADQGIMSENKWLQKYVSLVKPSIDPVVFFSSFNDSNQSNAVRIKRINSYCRIFGLPGNFEDIDFEGCPSPPTVKLMSSRSDANQFTLWITFINVMRHGKQALNIDVFEKLKDIYGVDIVSFTIWLFWINASVFLPLDRNTVRYLIQEGSIERQPKTFDEYWSLLADIKEPTLEISIKAYRTAHPIVEMESRISEPISAQPENNTKQKIIRTPGNFRVIAIKLLKNIDPDLKKVLIINKIYSFYKAYTFVNKKEITYDPAKDIQLYNQGDLPVIISAVVGKNGSGKSSITELLYLAINNLAEKHKDIKTELERGDGLHLELYYIADFLYRITFKNGEISVERFKTLDKRYVTPKYIPFEIFDLDQFFYTIAINYSHYGLNSRHIGDWISNLFHKNDSYQAPIVINPYRENGNIDVNVEESLTKSRLLSNLLQPVLPDDESKNDHLRRLTDDATAKTLTLTFDASKFRYLYEYREKDENGKWRVIKQYQFSDSAAYFTDVLTATCEVFDINKKLLPPNWEDPKTPIDYAFLYILKKLISIAITYGYWSQFFEDADNKFNGYRLYLDHLHIDHSHITYKLRQAINFIRKNHIRGKLRTNFKKETRQLSINDLADEIALAIANEKKEALETIYLIPPSFFKVKIWLDTKGEFEKLSSGEKQRIYAVSSLAYHLLNLNSINVQNDLLFYRYINIVFDEAELYFHPEMQRGFIKYLLSYIKRLDLSRISGINICIITHSPFILSDIPDHNILFLGKTDPHIRTLGSNIHDLLAHSFFLDKGFMGDYIKGIVQDLVKFLDPAENEKPKDWTSAKAKQVIEAIGEPLIRYRLDEMYKVKYAVELTKAERITALKKELADLE